MKLLVVEDDEQIARFLVRGLSDEGHLLQLAKDGPSGLELARSGQFDVIILDLMLPRMDGREICRTLRMEGVPTQILMLTALETTQDIVRGLRLGADDYLTKPFAFDELLARLEVLHRRAGAVTDNSRILQAGDVVFDPQTLTLTCKGQPVEMTSLEFALLEFLMTEKGKVVSRARILQNVWGAHEDPLTNVVEVYIRRIRMKLLKHGVTDLITTIRGRGYRLQDALIAT